MIPPGRTVPPPLQLSHIALSEKEKRPSPVAQKKLLSDERLQDSETVLPIIRVAAREQCGRRRGEVKGLSAENQVAWCLHSPGRVVYGPAPLCLGSHFEAVEAGEEVFDVRGKLLVGNVLRGPAQRLTNAREKVDILDPCGVFRSVH